MKEWALRGPSMRDRTFFNRAMPRSPSGIWEERDRLDSIGEFAIARQRQHPAPYFVLTSTCPPCLIALITILVLRTEKGWTGQWGLQERHLSSYSWFVHSHLFLGRIGFWISRPNHSWDRKPRLPGRALCLLFFLQLKLFWSAPFCLSSSSCTKIPIHLHHSSLPCLLPTGVPLPCFSIIPLRNYDVNSRVNNPHPPEVKTIATCTCYFYTVIFIAVRI